MARNPPQNGPYTEQVKEMQKILAPSRTIPMVLTKLTEAMKAQGRGLMPTWQPQIGCRGATVIVSMGPRGP